MKLLLWDIDGTLVNVKRLGARAMNEAFQKTYKTDAFIRARNMAGKTDLEILKGFLAENSIPFRDLKAESRRIIPLYVRNLGKHLRGNPEPFVYSNARELLDRYRRSGKVVHGLLTGNYKKAARLKLHRFGLWKYFELGAFGEVSAVRADLVPAALERFRKKYRREISPEDVFIIGDTPNDVEIAKTHGLRSVAVATGIFSKEELKACGAEFVLKDLTEFPTEEIESSHKV